MNKPKRKTRTYLDYHECSEFLEKKYGYKERDYLGYFKRNENGERVNLDIEYQDFWHWVCDNKEIHNPCEITFSQEEYDDFKNDESTPEFVKTIYNYYLKEFADENGEVEMEVSW